MSVQSPQQAGGPVWCEIERDVVRVSGPDAEAYLQGQCSQDVAAIGPGQSAWSFVLQPSGKVAAFARVTSTADGFLLDTDGGYGAALVERLRMFLLRTKATIEPLAWRCLAVRNPGPTLVTTTDAMAARANWHGAPGVDLLGPSVEAPIGARPIDRAGYERLRVEAGWPAMGSELTADTIPAEAGVIPESVSFTKGCYTGQELVARIDSRGGHVPRLLRHVRLAGRAAPGTHLTVEGKDVGVLTSVTGNLALAYVGRAVQPPATADLGTIEAIPGARFASS
jgi:folate-binding protein YgfZ